MSGYAPDRLGSVAMRWFGKTPQTEVWDEKLEEPLGDIEASQKIRAICRAVADSAEKLGKPDAHSAKKLQRERERYERAAKIAMELAMKISDELMRDASVREIIGICMKANNIKTATALLRAIRAPSIRAEVLKEHPALGEQT